MAAGSAVMLQLIINAQPGLEPSPQKTQRPPRTKPYVKTGDKLLVMRAASK
jgi:hypothetical protein